MTSVALVRGVGDVGSAIAHVLYRHGVRVALHDMNRPAYPRRGMAFTDALFEGRAMLEDVLAKNSRPDGHVAAMLLCGRAIPVLDCPLDALLAAMRPGILIDARMRKRADPEPQRGFAPLVIGLGPGFVAGANADWVVETQWGSALGHVLTEGGVAPLAGEPKPIAGHGRDRFIYAPAAGLFRTACRIGQRVRKGDAVARIGREVLAAPLDGVLRGLTHDGVEVPQSAKVIEVDPRDEPAGAFGLGERPRRIAEGIACALSNAGDIA